jgi:hypothetical protein
LRVGAIIIASRNIYSATAKDVARLMRMFLGTIDALATAVETEADPMAALDDAVGWNKLLRVRDEVVRALLGVAGAGRRHRSLALGGR